MKTFLGVDGGGTKTDFLLIDAAGAVLASHRGGSAYYLESGFEALQAMMAVGIQTTLQKAGITASELEFAFLGLPAYGEDKALLTRLDGIVADVLAAGRYRCGNDVVCGWAGALGAGDGINIVAGTGSIAYGEYQGRGARAGGWGELFSDEGSAHWMAREALSLFSRMSDGRAPRGPWYDLVRQHFDLKSDLDVCAAIYGDGRSGRSDIAALAPLVARAAAAGDAQAVELFHRAAGELKRIVDAVYDQLDIPAQAHVTVSYSGGMFNERALLLEPFLALLSKDARSYRVAPPRLPPVAGAALYAAKLSGAPLDAPAIHQLESSFSHLRS